MSAAKLGFTRARLLCAGFAAAERIADNFIDFGSECAAYRPGDCYAAREFRDRVHSLRTTRPYLSQRPPDAAARFAVGCITFCTTYSPICRPMAVPTTVEKR